MYSTQPGKLRLPPLKPGSSGWAYPDPNRTLACVRVPVAVSFEVSGAHAYWIALKPGEWHIVQPNCQVHYRNAELDNTNIYHIMGVLPESDSRVQFLQRFWSERGYQISEVRAARKIAPTPVVGVVTEEAVGRTVTTHEAIFTLRRGMLLMQSPQDPSVYWFIPNLQEYSYFVGEDGKRVKTRK